MTNLSWNALGTTAVVRAPRASLHAAQRAAFRVVERIDRLASRFRDDSELSLINRGAGDWAAISPELAELIELGVSAAEQTGGAVDPTLARELARLGYDRDFSELDSVNGDRPLTAGLPLSDDRRSSRWQSIELRADRGMIRLPATVELDLGATAKGRAADLACAAAHRATGAAVLVSLGGDIAVVGEPPEGEWSVGLADDHRVAPHDCDAAVTIRSGGLATSSLIARRWWHGGEAVHHVLDPRTGLPVTPRWRTVTVAAGTCADANVAATAALVLGDAAPAWLRSRGLPSRLVAADGGLTRVAGWPA